MTLRQEAAAVAGALALLCAVFTAGRITAPAADVHTVDDSVAVHTVTSVVKTAHDTVQDSRQVRVVYRERLPNGTQTETERVTTDTHFEELDRSEAIAVVADTAAKHHDQTVTAYRPEWRLNLLAGASLQTPTLPLAGPLVVGVEVSRRVLGPVWVGVWGLTAGTAGVSVGVEF